VEIMTAIYFGGVMRYRADHRTGRIEIGSSSAKVMQRLLSSHTGPQATPGMRCWLP
jgi:hypothetical protein